MNGDFSRWTAPNARARGYAGVLMQQGRLHTDADWNEQVALTARRAETALADVIGRSGAPKAGGGFAISPAAPPAGFAISAGRFYLDGALIENPEPTTYAGQGDPVETEALTELLANGAEGLIYLEAWKEHVSTFDDARLSEPALGGPDTATRVAIRWRVGVMPNPFQGAARTEAIERARKGLELDIAAWAPGSGGLIASLAPAEELEDDDDCLIPPEAGYLSQENQLYRVEIVRGGTRAQSRFVWSRENASVVAGLARNADGAFVLVGAREDEALGFVSGGWVEVYDDATRRRGESGRLTRMTLQDGVATFAPAIQAFDDMVSPQVRRWDHPVGSPPLGLPLRTQPTLLERGVQVAFANGDYRVGDYWVIPARAATGTVDWPPYPAEPDAPIPPFGWGRRFAPLALARRSGGGVAQIVDLRPLFPALTCIEASDVRFDDAVCGIGAETVQEAIDALCARGRGKCTIFARDAAALRAGVAALTPGQNAHICLGDGVFAFDETLRIAGLTHLTISGAGPQSLMTVGGDEAALMIEDCASVRLEDFAARGGQVGSSGRLRGRLGAITLRGCADVAVERVNAVCRAGPWRHASCIAVYAGARPGPVRVRDCRLTVGQGQSGVQIIGAARALVENCRIIAAPAPPEVVARRLRADGALVSLIARGMVNLSAASAEGAPAPVDPTVGGAAGRTFAARGRAARGTAGFAAAEFAAPVTVALADSREVRLNVHPLAANAVGAYLERAPGLSLRDAPTAKALILNVAKEAVRSGGSVTVGGQVINDFRAYMRRVPERTFFFEGIVIAGPRVEEAQVLGNVIEGAQNGVRIAASSASDPNPPNWREREPTNVVARAVVERNRVSLLPPGPAAPAHGVYLGHARCFEINGNDVTGPEGGGRDTLWYGVRSFGYRGRLAAMTRNSSANVRVGASMMPDLDADGAWPGARWVASVNGVLDVPTPTELAAGVIEWP